MIDNSTAIACVGLGTDVDKLACCYVNNQTAPACTRAFADPGGLLQRACPSGNCLDNCQNERHIYPAVSGDTRITGNGGEQDGAGPVMRYAACANTPIIASFVSQGLLLPSISTAVQKYIPQGANNSSLRNITSAVTDCLSSTCRNSRFKDSCYNDYCSPVKLLLDNTTPNLPAINRCLNKLCTSHANALPYADADIVGIGVFWSYILQCIFIIVLWFGILFAALLYLRKCTGKAPRRPIPSEMGVYHSSWVDLLLEFHKAQCYFIGTLMVAAFTEGVFHTNMVVRFMLVPLSINGIAPIVFAYFLLVYYRNASTGITLLTIIVYCLSTTVYWALYTPLIGLKKRLNEGFVYEQFVYKLSAIPACGGYSALAACPNGPILPLPLIERAGDKIRVLTPLIWSFSTIVLLLLLGNRLHKWFTKPKDSLSTNSSNRQTKVLDSRQSRPWAIAFWMTAIAFVASIGMQLSLLSISVSLKMTDPDWGFGQIVAITIWIPPLLEYFYGLTKMIREKRKHAQTAKDQQEPIDAEEKSKLQPHSKHGDSVHRNDSTAPSRVEEGQEMLRTKVGVFT